MKAGGLGFQCTPKHVERSHPTPAYLSSFSSSRCNKNIKKINANGRTVLAKVTDECDSVNGCDAENSFEPPCRNDVVTASAAVRKALAIPEAQIGYYDVAWSDA
ncbi:unnamed protein product [Musa acuminata subsp. malaccensis]|uniref:(wild Malaysian banana) hypothetical protein n=1 Tax=Musa acuminata subsp. malaccensis TaxID=214687 RepID=A0A804IWQ4_MUSAM|nr:unnamed protein product [Musa acuminata subsp. malaccensis]